MPNLTKNINQAISQGLSHEEIAVFLSKRKDFKDVPFEKIEKLVKQGSGTKKTGAFQVTVTAIRAKTGKKVKIKVDAEEALANAKADVEKFKSFLDGLQSSNKISPVKRPVSKINPSFDEVKTLINNISVEKFKSFLKELQ